MDRQTDTDFPTVGKSYSLDFISLVHEPIFIEYFLFVLTPFAFTCSISSTHLDFLQVASDLSTGIPTLDLIVRGLTQPLDFDLRNHADKPLFRKNIASMKELHPGVEVILLIGKKVEVSLRLFDTFERNMVFIFLFENWGSRPSDWGLQ